MNTIVTVIAAGLALWAGISVVVALTIGRMVWLRDRQVPHYHRIGAPHDPNRIRQHQDH